MRLIRAIGMLWVLPVAAAIWLCYIIPVWLLGWVSYDGWARFGVVRLRVTAPPSCWFTKTWHGWAGCGLPFVIIINYDTTLTQLHELRHTDQWLLLGPLFPVVYGMLFAIAGYHDNLLEQDAREWAHHELARRAPMIGGRR